MASLDVLRSIMARDPDGGSKQPTAEDYAAHQTWAVATYGQAAWNAYCVPGWGEGHDGDNLDNPREEW